jgi:2,5-diamino-6-(ribosylamino)-4(3H)-pyrimidinone 5'-phosphate reductase
MSRHVVVHAAVSLDGATTGFEPDVQRFYELAARWREQVTLTGADTILAQEPLLADAPRPGPAPDGPVLAVVDARRRVTAWDALRECGRWCDVVALRAAGAGGGDRSGGASLREIVTAGRRVDLAAALDELGGEVVRVDSGGALSGALLREGLVDEISLLVHPCLACAAERRWYGSATEATLEPLAAEMLDGGLAWLRYRVAADGRSPGPVR